MKITCLFSFFPEDSVLVLPLELQNLCLGHLPMRVAAAQESTGEWEPSYRHPVGKGIGALIGK